MGRVGFTRPNTPQWRQAFIQAGDRLKTTTDIWIDYASIQMDATNPAAPGGRESISPSAPKPWTAPSSHRRPRRRLGGSPHRQTYIIRSLTPLRHRLQRRPHRHYDVAANNGANTIEGRASSPTSSVRRRPDRHLHRRRSHTVAIAQKNGLYAAAGSNGKIHLLQR